MIYPLVLHFLLLVFLFFYNTKDSLLPWTLEL